MNKLTVVFLVLALVVGMNGLAHAQVEFHVDTDQPIASYGTFSQLNEDQKTVVDFLYLTQKEQNCTANVTGQTNIEATICVFDDPTKADTQHLYVAGAYNVRFVIYHNGDVVHVLSREQGLGALRSGEYMIQVLYTWSGLSLLSTVSFSIGGESDVESADRLFESVTLATPALDTKWDQAEKHTMASKCRIAHVRSDYDAPALTVFLLGEETVKVIESHELSRNGQTRLLPDIEEEGDFEGLFGVASLYLNPEHNQQYRLIYYRAGVAYEVVFNYQAGITGNRNVMGAIIIECEKISL